MESARVETFTPPVPQAGAHTPEQITGMAEAAKAGSFQVGIDVLKEAPTTKPGMEKPATGAPGDKVIDRPEWLPSKFKTVEDMAKAYGELEKKQGGKPVADKKAPSGGLDDLKVAKPEAEKATEDQAAEKVVEAAGLDMEGLRNEFAQNAELSAESLAKLAKVGIDKHIVDQYIAGQAAIGESRRRDLETVVGGGEQLNQVIDWSRSNLSKSEAEAWDATLATNNHDAIKLALSSLHAKWQAAGQDEPAGQITGSRAGESVDVYRDHSELHRDIASKEYKTSEAFRQQVKAKLGRSNI